MILPITALIIAITSLAASQHFKITRTNPSRTERITPAITALIAMWLATFKIAISGNGTTHLILTIALSVLTALITAAVGALWILTRMGPTDIDNDAPPNN